MKLFNNNKIIFLIILAILFIVPFMITNQYILHIIITILLYSILSMSLNFVSGNAGQISVGHAAFYGIGAYTTSILMINAHLSFITAMLLGGLLAGICGIFLGIPSLRVKGNYLCIITLGFGEIVKLILLNWDKVTGGPMGISSIPNPEFLNIFKDKNLGFYYLILFLFVIFFVILYKLTYSNYGLLMLAVRENEIAATSLGVNITSIKFFAFIISSFIAGIAGGFYATYVSFISPESFMFKESITILAMVIIGGKGNIVGSIIGAIVLAIIPEFLREFNDYRMLFYGLGLVLMIVFRPDGIYGLKYRKKFTYKS
ncbi:branched-chain amino acid ABC transporter permease [Clostridium sporogenes]|uniref:Branched-chain amino acid ABC transporter permease n=1 Tax=Clostridium sporogenes TaxID=1509 RepID=A0AAE4JW15_CLOSG|nr:branched-chain amino acid ABC transporter permease [Clostridium sporogenes]MDS1004659.1 branched-chain amino acid ABC transporter permease [Clostridium sporogenes]